MLESRCLENCTEGVPSALASRADSISTSGHQGGGTRTIVTSVITSTAPWHTETGESTLNAAVRKRCVSEPFLGNTKHPTKAGRWPLLHFCLPKVAWVQLSCWVYFMSSCKGVWEESFQTLLLERWHGDQESQSVISPTGSGAGIDVNVYTFQIIC